MKKALIIFVVLAIAAGGYWFLRKDRQEIRSPYRFVRVERGDLEAVVSTTGTLDAVTTVKVGTQVSGIISEINVDFNDTVRRGQVIARLDTTLLESAVRDAEANLERNQAQLRHAQREYERIDGLYRDQIVAEQDFNTAQYDLDVAKASVKSAEVALERAEKNLGYATIKAPISGTVIERNVDVGQTVASSLSTPQLFLIAADLSKMQILASVDESDIGKIAEGQKCRFTVQAYPDDTFEGSVRQVRMQSSSEENVVNYTVVVDVSNSDGRLLPGMTTTVDFLVQRAADVLMVPNAALRFRATEAMFAEARARMQTRGERHRGEGEAPADAQRSAHLSGREMPSSAGGAASGPSGMPSRMHQFMGEGSGAGGHRREDVNLLWFLGDDGGLEFVPVQTGITDGQSTEIHGPRIEAGMEVIAGVTRNEDSSQVVNPFQKNSERSGRHGPPPPGGF